MKTLAEFVTGDPREREEQEPLSTILSLVVKTLTAPEQGERLSAASGRK
jgi:hypothetical protein